MIRGDALGGPNSELLKQNEGRRVAHRYSDPPEASRSPSNGIPRRYFVSAHNLRGCPFIWNASIRVWTGVQWGQEYIV
eukprot:6296960-Pyramimonas_sp.AAC.1